MVEKQGVVPFVGSLCEPCWGLQGLGGFVAGTEVVVVGMEGNECKESSMLAVTCRRAARSSPMSCESMCCSLSES